MNHSIREAVIQWLDLKAEPKRRNRRLITGPKTASMDRRADERARTLALRTARQVVAR